MKAIGDYKLYYDFTKKMIEDFKDYEAESLKLKKIILLNTEMFFRIINPSEQGKELRADILQNIDTKLDEVSQVFNSYMDYKEGKIDQKEFLNSFLNKSDTAMNEIREEMKDKSQAQELHQDKNSTRKNR